MGQTSNAVLKLGDIVNSKLSIVLADYTIANIINTDAQKVLLDEIEEQITETANKTVSVNMVSKYSVPV